MESMRQTVSRSLAVNRAEMERLMPNDQTVLCHPFAPAGKLGEQVRCCLFCIDGMVDSGRVNECLVRPVVLLRERPEGPLADFLERQVLHLCECRQTADFPDTVQAVLSGDTIVFCEGSERALVLGTRGFPTRGVSEPDSERVVKGPREGFVESLRCNQSLLRRKLSSPALRYESLSVGGVTHTSCCLCYLDGVVDRRVLAIVRRRLSRVRIDGVLDSNYLSELVRDSPRSPFRTAGTTERPDVAAAKLLEGRVVLLVDGSPVALSFPHIFLEHLQSSGDYYVGFAYASFNRMLRVLGFFFAVALAPCFLLALTHEQALLPLPLLSRIAAVRQALPLPPAAELLCLLLCFDLLREAGSRTPNAIGQTVSIVGGLVIGQAAVDAQLVAASTLIVVALSGVSWLVLPRLKTAIILWRTVLLLATAFFGLTGWALALLALAARLAAMESCGVPYLSSLPLSGEGSAEDSLIRPPFGRMRRFGRFLARNGEGQP